MRLFIAIDLPASVRAALDREQARLREACAGRRDIRWTPEGLHLTLKFLGQVELGRLPQITSALKVLGGFEPFEVEVGGFGFFPSARRPRVFWVGLEAPPALGRLASRVEAAAESLGFARENRQFQPHLTLARFEEQRPQPALEAALRAGRAGGFGRFTVTEFFLFESKLRPGGAQYSRIESFPGAGHRHAEGSAPSRPKGSSW